jgi:hypothetical protein
MPAWKTMFLANKWGKRSNVFSCDRYGVSAASESSADLRVMFAFFFNRLGCIGSLIVSVTGSLVLILVLRGCGAF